MEEVEGFTPQLAKGGTQWASTPGTVPCPHLGELRDCIQPGSPGSLSPPSAVPVTLPLKRCAFVLSGQYRSGHHAVIKS